MLLFSSSFAIGSIEVLSRARNSYHSQSYTQMQFTYVPNSYITNHKNELWTTDLERVKNHLNDPRLQQLDSFYNLSSILTDIPPLIAVFEFKKLVFGIIVDRTIYNLETKTILNCGSPIKNVNVYNTIGDVPSVLLEDGRLIRLKIEKNELVIDTEVAKNVAFVTSVQYNHLIIMRDGTYKLWRFYDREAPIDDIEPVRIPVNEIVKVSQGLILTTDGRVLGLRVVPIYNYEEDEEPDPLRDELASYVLEYDEYCCPPNVIDMYPFVNKNCAIVIDSDDRVWMVTTTEMKLIDGIKNPKDFIHSYNHSERQVRVRDMSGNIHAIELNGSVGRIDIPVAIISPRRD